MKAVNKKKVLESNVYTEIEVLRKVLHPYIIRLYAAYEQGKKLPPLARAVSTDARAFALEKP